ncbi:hypothetical protein BB560_000205 [Smittium megazygosporum]|uniref:Elongation of fatty acids protein n=1 Tax=Smittium megazygosporum TaxID=133381 RepID=A0A2T9ZL38_9FUNG|nr:hypothetical protein BB560_000205 [Smittium megazygosporum]
MSFFELKQWPPAGITVNPDEFPLGSLAKYAMRADYMLIFIALYVGLVHYCQPSAEKSTMSRIEAKRTGSKVAVKTKNGPIFNFFVLAHNVALALYSMYTFYNSVSLFISTALEEGLESAYCDSNFTCMNNGLFKLSYLFYLSKYYEVIDTAIILLKGRRSSTLQTYHHAGAILCMWIDVNNALASVFYFVIVNSFVHSVMYTYFAFSSLGFYLPGKQYLTSLQITQFLCGFVYAVYYALKPNCASPSQRFGTWVNIAYLLPLTYLFFDFAFRTYGKKKPSSKKSD